MAPRLAQVPVPAKLGDCDGEDVDRSETRRGRERGATWCRSWGSLVLQGDDSPRGFTTVDSYLIVDTATDSLEIFAIFACSGCWLLSPGGGLPFV